MDLATGRIDEVCLHVDVLGVMQQAGQYPLPPPTGTCGSTKESTLAIKDTKCQEQISEYCTASVNSLPTLRQPSRNAQPPTGVMLNPVPGPRTHDGILAQPQDEEETAKTYNLIEEHVAGGFLFP